MATVYLGTDTRLDRVVAIKIAHPEFADDAEFVRRFIGEARSAARLSSPNVVGIYDQGSDGQLHFIVMEYVPGRTLRELITERGRLSQPEALEIMTGVLSGLAAAHEAGLAHRDVKPENVLLTSSGAVKVADFGLARSVSGSPQTRAGMIIGTAAYLAPEQVSGGASDARTDVYAAGIMLFEMLTGTQPHTAESPLAVAYKHVNEVVPAPSSVAAGISPLLDALVAMATSRDPELRPGDAGQFLQAISNARDGRAASASGSYPAPGGPYQAPYPAPYPAGASPYPAPVPHQPGAWDSGARYPGTWDSGSRSGGPPAARWDSGSGPALAGASALPSLSPQHTESGPIPPASQPGMNHTLIVPAGAMGAGFQQDGYRPGGYQPGGRGATGRLLNRAGHRATARRPGGPREPWLQQLLFSRRFIYLTGGIAALLVLTLTAWWLTAGQYTTVPKLSGVMLSTARTELGNLGLKAQVSGREHSTVPAGEVISTTPATGAQVTGGATIGMLVSLGPVLVQVPNVTGQPLAQAKILLQQAHLAPGQVTNAVSATVAPGSVITTTPGPFAQAPEHSQVGLTVSAGPGLPDFTGQQLAAVQATAAAGGYQVNANMEATGTQPAGAVDKQDPAPNTPITPGEVVQVWVSPGPPTTAVPNVQGMKLGDAENALQQAGFQFTVNQSGPGHTVCSASPTGNQPPGTSIQLNLGLLNGCI